jgi:hypothetical protein
LRLARPVLGYDQERASRDNHNYGDNPQSLEPADKEAAAAGGSRALAGGLAGTLQGGIVRHRESILELESQRSRKTYFFGMPT